ncbi:multidrug resistance ABC transporter ATPase component [Streptococcus equi subsp. zooepidemicus Sz16]|uniref:ABC transporter ATP-binding protein n=1 Tax=Streptococcus equi TaxID=1336 RepID=UPI0005B7B7FF|nr:ABC transporter ATP-binding protein [Streptococcus equi]KIS04664.1 multidrug resistance ABC transporter ATPase component [Streptococcus equi subsp. zooepidemicus Sz16]KIS15271.1 multidrug resistance ABC transporter ATPase component [Streptococcus equi subsp. zooepidemicus SzAM35]MDI5945889.1 ABC transporter ATP-binding protein [Streptococcus equi subsp. zooepidemicus]VTP85732.1 multidrug resistance ABC transporter ATPase component [Streptococcus equi subsp. zooepidemicus]HEK9996534.1 ABC tr
MENLLEVKKLSKTYKNGRKALDNLNFNVTKGEILGFLGPNGAGKSTTINILSTLLQSDEGEIIYFNDENLSIKDVKKQLGIVPQELAIYEDISASQNVKFFASLYGAKKSEINEKVESALKKVGLEDRKDDKPSTFSGGMKRRLNIACAIVHSPKLIIFDEPTVGIDPQSRNHILDSIKNLRDEGATIIYTTHYMEEVQQICDRVIIMDGGVVLLNDSLDDILEHYSNSNYQVRVDQQLPPAVLDEIRELTNVEEVNQKDEFEMIFSMCEESMPINGVLEVLIKFNLNITSITMVKKNLEDVFLLLTGKKLRD